MMSNRTRKCKICGCEYPYCKTMINSKFRYQDVACSPEHAAEYFRRIDLSRIAKEPVKDYEINIVDDDDEDESDSFDEDFEDTDEEIEAES